MRFKSGVQDAFGPACDKTDAEVLSKEIFRLFAFQKVASPQKIGLIMNTFNLRRMARSDEFLFDWHVFGSREKVFSFNQRQDRCLFERFCRH